MHQAVHTRSTAIASLAALLLIAAGVAWMLPQPAQGPPPSDPLTVLQAARRTCAAEVLSVTLPDRVAPGHAAECDYRFVVAHAEQGFGVFIPGLAAHARIDINGQRVAEGLQDVRATVPRGADRIVQIVPPEGIWRTDGNVIDIRAAGPRGFTLSRLYVGPVPEIKRLHRLRLAGVVVGPSLAAAVVGTVGLCMVLLWARRRTALSGYFAAGTLAWSAHTFWSVLPWPLLIGLHYWVWWTSLYTFFFAMLVIFCIRFAEWSWPRFERAVWGVTLATPAVLYLAAQAHQMDTADELWRLLLIALTAVGVLAVARASFERPGLDRLLIVAAGSVSLVFAVHDWFTHLAHDGDNPTYLVPYASLVFVVFVVHMLIDRFAGASEQLERLNVKLEQRVASQNLELHDAIEEMRLARDAAEAADRAKTHFLAAASHDLRQPAHALALYMAALRAEPLEPVQAELVQRMSASLSALETMFSMLLDMSRIDGGGLTPSLRVFAIEPLLRRLAEEFAPQLEARGLRLALRLPPASSAFTRSDPALVEQVLRNLIANSTKYTTRGGVLIACRLRRAAPSQVAPQWRIEIWDSGVGIAESDLPRVFEEFFQADNPGRDRAKGLGLGLSIVRRLVTLLDLALDVRSRVGRGSCFALRLRWFETVDAQPSALPPVSASTTVSGMTVAMIEDDVEVRDAMRQLLQCWGCRVFEGADADELLLHMAQSDNPSPPHAVLVDHRLRHGKTGAAEADRLFARWQTQLPMLVLTGESDLRQIRAAGHACLPKPVSPTLLSHWLASLQSLTEGDPR